MYNVPSALATLLNVWRIPDILYFKNGLFRIDFLVVQFQNFNLAINKYDRAYKR